MGHRFDAYGGLALDPTLSFDNYHDVEHLLPTEFVSFSIECVCCRNRTATGDAHPLIPTHRDPSVATGPLSIPDTPSHQMHMPLILPCGHIAGWSCLETEPTGRCPACRVIWCRDRAGSLCHHPIGINPFRSVSAMTPDEAPWLLPRGGHVPERCRRCVTLDALRELTELARGPTTTTTTLEEDDGAVLLRRCVYATDGVLGGFLAGDELRPFVTLDIAADPALIPGGLLDEARRREEVIRAQFEGLTPLAESEVVGAARGMGFGFRVAGLVRPEGDQEGVGGARGC